MNKINRDKITPQILDKIKEVNDEAGYRTYLEVPEMIRIICEVVEANYNVIPMDWKEIEFVNNLYCFKEHKYAHSGHGKCTACGASHDSVEYYNNHHAMINL
jgi:hypothetical protein